MYSVVFTTGFICSNIFYFIILIFAIKNIIDTEITYHFVGKNLTIHNIHYKLVFKKFSVDFYRIKFT